MQVYGFEPDFALYVITAEGERAYADIVLFDRHVHTLSQAHQFHGFQLLWVHQPVNVILAQLPFALALFLVPMVSNFQFLPFITAENVCNGRSAHVERHSQVLDAPPDPVLSALAAVVEADYAPGYENVKLFFSLVFINLVALALNHPSIKENSNFEIISFNFD